jgi:hypothetical protein
MPVHPTQGALRLIQSAKQRQKIAAKSGNIKRTNRKTKTRIFKLFNKLPVELRLKIWQYASQSPRLIAANWDTQVNEVRYQSFYTLHAGPVPTVLHINRESRNEGLRYFKQIKKYIVFNGPDTKENRIYIQEQDTIYFVRIAARHDFGKTLRLINRDISLSHFAFRVERMDELMKRYYTGSTNVLRAMLHNVVLDLPNLTHIMAAFDASHFSITKIPQDYEFRYLPPTKSPNRSVRGKMDPSKYRKKYENFSWNLKDEVLIPGIMPLWRKLVGRPAWKPPICEMIHIKKR